MKRFTKRQLIAPALGFFLLMPISGMALADEAPGNESITECVKQGGKCTENKDCCPNSNLSCGIEHGHSGTYCVPPDNSPKQ